MTAQDRDERTALWRARNNEFHEALVRERGEGWQAFWGSRESQERRYQVFLRHLSLQGRSVLDVGCGFGDFMAYMRRNQVHVSRYVGIDLDPVIIDGARRKQPDCEFVALDILEADPPLTPDIIVASGIAALHFDGYEDYVLRILRRFQKLCRKSFAINFLSSLSPKRDARSHYVDPSWLLSLFQNNIDWRCSLHHGYRQNDFTLIHSKGDQA